MQASCDCGYEHLAGAYESQAEKKKFAAESFKVCVFPLALVAHDILSDVVDVTPAVW